MKTTISVLILVLFLAGCATMQNTPQQDYVWTCVDACTAQIPPQCQVTRIDTDGRYHAICHTSSAMWRDFSNCLQEQYKSRPYQEWIKQNGRTTK